MKRGAIASLRDLAPLRPLTRHEALSIAERQALRFLVLAGIETAPVPEHVISGLPRMQVERVTALPASGAAQWADGRWLILLNRSEPATRQRFSLAHELKHVVDHPFVDRLYGSIDASERAAWIEQVCDYFAGCLLMPRPWLKRAYAARPDVTRLAQLFEVSRAAMNMRLNQIGMTDALPRCERPTTRRPPTRSRTRYERRATLLVGQP